jgi:hypothetical protein
MSMAAGVLLTQDAATRTKAAVLAYERTPARAREGRRNRNHAPLPPIRGVLLQDLATEGVADCAITTKVSSPAAQEIEIVGGQNHASDTFRVSFKGQTSTPISTWASAADMQAALEAMETIGKGNVAVSLGVTPAEAGRPQENPGIWLVEFIGAFLSRDPATTDLLTTNSSSNNLWAIVTAKTTWADSGSVVQVHDILPVGVPTPMRAGAVVAAIHYPTVGYGVIACEARQFAPAGYY